MPSNRRVRARKDKTLPRGKKDQRQDKRLINLEKNVRALKTIRELKYIDTNQASAAILTAGSLLLLNGVVVGDTQLTREGAQIIITSLQVRLTFETASGLSNNPLVRMIIFWDKQANGTAPTVAGNPLTPTIALLNNATITSSLIAAPYQHENVERFTPVFDKTYVMNANIGTVGATDDYGPVTHHVKKFIKLRRTVKYGDEGSATVGSINTNSLYVLLLCDTTAAVLQQGGYRVYFKDPS